MKDVKILYNAILSENDDYFCVGNYEPITEEIGNTVIVVEDSDYQGDTRILYDNKDGKIGYLQFGWGSCSGCDALQGCDTWDEVQELADYLEQSVDWFDSKEEALQYFEDHDWEGDYSWHQDEQIEFIFKATEYLRGLK